MKTIDTTKVLLHQVESLEEIIEILRAKLATQSKILSGWVESEDRAGEIQDLYDQLATAQAQAKRLQIDMQRILDLASDRTTRPRTLRTTVAGIAAGSIASNAYA